MEFFLGALVFGLGALFGAAIATNAVRSQTREEDNGIQ